MSSIIDTINSLTVGQVSGLIAFGVAFITFTAPLLLGVVLLKYYNKDTTAATWTVISRQLHSSAWPTLLSADSTAHKNVDLKVTIIAYANFWLAIIITIAGVVTPLGLGDSIAVIDTKAADFSYYPDTKFFGLSTQSRSDMPVSRDCGYPSFICPGANHTLFELDQEDQVLQGYKHELLTNTQVPSNVIDMFKSYSKNSTIAGLFDIQYRSWKRTNTANIDGGEQYVVGKYKNIESLIPQNTTVLVEGLVVDMEKGGVGFRNHSGPSPDGSAASWEEDILWIEPEVSCTSLNLSYHFTVTGLRERGVNDTFLVDEGVIAGLEDGYSDRKWPIFTPGDVKQRLEVSALMHQKLFTEAFDLLNLTESPGNMTRNLSSTVDITNSLMTPIGIKAAPLRTYNFLGIGPYSFDKSGNLWTQDIDAIDHYGKVGKGPYHEKSQPPERLKMAELLEVRGRCTGKINEYTRDGDANIMCGYFLSLPTRRDGGSPLEEENGSKWKTNLFMCAGGVKASVQTISFSANQSSSEASLTDMSVRGRRPKKYEDESEMPVWALEDWHYHNQSGAIGAPLWGIVDESYNGIPGFNFTRSETFHIPGNVAPWTTSSIDTIEPRDSLAGAFAPFAVLNSLFHIAMSNGKYAFTKYDGSESLALREKWGQMSKRPEDVEQILKIIWTDIMASYTVGTRPRPIQAEASSSSGGPVGMVSVMGRKITYDFRFAAAAIVLIVCYMAIIAAAIAIITSYAPLLWQMKHLLNDTSVGRSAAPAAFEDARGHARSPTKKWLTAVGHMRLRLGEEYLPLAPVEEEEDANNTPREKEQPRVEVRDRAPSEASSLSNVSEDDIDDDAANLIKNFTTVDLSPLEPHPSGFGYSSRQRVNNPVSRSNSQQRGGGTLSRSNSWRSGDEDRWSTTSVRVNRDRKKTLSAVYTRML